MTESMAGFEVDDAGGSRVGSVHGVYVDAESGEPAWLIVALGRRRVKKLVAVPISDCAPAAGRVWVAHDRETLRSAPGIDPTRPLLREHELTICGHYGIGERVGRAAEVVGRIAGNVASRPA
jgi:PRC-barrel domain